MTFDKVSDLAKRRGFIWGPSPNIYNGGVSGFYDWGINGKLLKNKVELVIRKGFSSYSFFEVESPTIMPKIVWEASGHYSNFFDFTVECKKCRSTYRADNLIKESLPNEKVILEISSLEKQIKKIKCPNCKSSLEGIKKYSLMMSTIIGSDKESFLRPETATTTYLLYPEYYRFFRTKLPFGVFQIGKAYRNEVSPRQHVFRTREFTQAEAQLFILKKDKSDISLSDLKTKLPLLSYDKKDPLDIEMEKALKNKLLKSKAYASVLEIAYEIITNIGLDKKRIRIKQHHPDELAHYALDAWDIEYKTERFGWMEVCGVHDRQDYDLKRHSEYSKTKFPGEIPHILEIACGVERLTYCLLENSFREDKGRLWLQFPRGMGPIDIAILPLIQKDGLPEKAKEIFKTLEKDFVCLYDETGSIGRRYARNDEIGTTITCTVDYESLKEGTITLRDVYTTRQIRVKISDLKKVIDGIIDGEDFLKLGKEVHTRVK